MNATGEVTPLTNEAARKQGDESKTNLPRKLSAQQVDDIPIDKEVQEFEEAAQEMLERMDLMLATVREIDSEADPRRRLEVCANIYPKLCLNQ